MLRLRRYRVFLFFAVIIVFLFIRISRRSEWARREIVEFTSNPLGGHEKPPLTAPKPTPQENKQQWTPRPQIAGETLIENPKPAATPAQQAAKPEEDARLPSNAAVEPDLAEAPAVAAAFVPGVVLPDRKPPPPEVITDQDSKVDIHPIGPPGRQEQPLLLNDEETFVEAIHWERQQEHFPVPTESLIHLPTGKPMRIPTIQYAFDDETRDAKIDREKKQTEIRDEFQKAWKGYKEKAWLHDELSPVTGKFRDPFCGWAATLVDALDTLWIMGLLVDFEEAAKAVDSIDFTTSPRNDIPMFETTIRYLGGLLAAYDVSGGKYKNLLSKAVELAEILIGAFDTPNRMPVLYYHWKPAFASQAHRASGRSNLAELGSLSLEFTRLAQLTGDHKYYDAVDRVTDALSEWQDRGTSMNGVFPENVDATGCNRTVDIVNSLPIGEPSASYELSSNKADPVGYTVPQPETVREPRPRKNPTQEDNNLQFEIMPGAPGTGAPSKGRIKGWAEAQPKKDGNAKTKRALNEAVGNSSAEETRPTATTPTAPTHPLTGLALDVGEAGAAAVNAQAAEEVCKPQGLSSTGSDKYSMGGGQDSTYEYFPKQYLLLGGLEKKYHKMYNLTMNAVRKHMLYRPMVPGNPDILFSGSVSTYGTPNEEDFVLSADVEHLTCFIGGMVGMGAKIFGIDGDLELAKKLTDGCVWAYGSTVTGIMPEGALVFPCVSATDCTFNETAYHKALDPSADSRDEGVAQYVANKAARKKKEEAAKVAAKEQEALDAAIGVKHEATAATEEPDLPDGPGSDSLRNPDPVSLTEKVDTLEKRQMLEDVNDKSNVGKDSVVSKPAPAEEKFQEKADLTEKELEAMAYTGYAKELPVPEHNDEALVDPSTPPTHAEYVANRIRQESLPPGFTTLKSRKYILRPEAIESVWYMYRITGETSWQDKGWKMFKAIQNATTTNFGNSAIEDVTSDNPVKVDEMESFWLAETLKYFYLLYSTPDVISLDEWVLNTEAHPFKRPT